LRLDIRVDQSAYLSRDLERGELDLALLKRSVGEKSGLAVWPERTQWVMSRLHPIDLSSPSLPLIGFPPACIYRRSAIHALESAGRRWHMAYSSSSLSGIQAALAAGIGIGILSEMSIQPQHRILTERDGFSPIDQTEVALIATPEANAATLRLAESLVAFYEAMPSAA
jgi:DNA-binding transcriptional LysR family regulator